jgi:hypothetical protein
MYPPGSVITVKQPDGSTVSYHCNGSDGNWYPNRALGGPIRRGPAIDLGALPAVDGGVLLAP